MHVLHHLDELAVFLAPVEAGYGDAVAEVRCKREDLIVYDQSARQIDATKNVKILVHRVLTFE